MLDNKAVTAVTKDWQQWHENYERPESSLARRLIVVRKRISEALHQFPTGQIRMLSMCAGDGRDLLGVLQNHPRAQDVRGRLVELNPLLAEQARMNSPAGIEVSCRDAGISDAYAGAAPANLLLCCGVFGNISDEHIRATIHAWPMLCAPDAIVIWTRGAFKTDRRGEIRHWVQASGFQELSFDGAPEPYGVGVAKMAREPMAFQIGTRFFTFHEADTQNDKVCSS